MALSLSQETEKAIRSYAHKRGIEPKDAADKLVNTAISRLAALAKYAEAQKAPAKPAKKGKDKKPAKKDKN